MFEDRRFRGGKRKRRYREERTESQYDSDLLYNVFVKLKRGTTTTNAVADMYKIFEENRIEAP
jgi:hypothetical protein